jgi:hypothetical protein
MFYFHLTSGEPTVNAVNWLFQRTSALSECIWGRPKRSAPLEGVSVTNSPAQGGVNFVTTTVTATDTNTTTAATTTLPDDDGLPIASEHLTDDNAFASEPKQHHYTFLIAHTLSVAYTS